MKKLLFVVFIAVNLSAQSIHQIESEYYSNHKSEIIINKQPADGNLNKGVGVKSRKTVFGFLPWWEYYAGFHEYIRYDLLTHLAVFLYEADGEGNLTMPINLPLPWKDVFDAAALNNVKLILSVTNFDSDEIHSIINNADSGKKLIDNIGKIISQFGFEGVIIDFENLKEGNDRQFAFKNFMVQLKTELSKINPNIEVSAALPTLENGSWDFKAIAEQCDYVFVMGYEYYGHWANTTGPSSPLVGKYISVTKTITEEYKNVSPGKIIMGVPYYGNLWKTNSDKPYAAVSPYDESKENNNWQSHVYFRDIPSTYSLYERQWDNTSGTPWFRLQESDTTWFQIWIDDSLSISLKYDLAIQNNLGGVGIWALGYDGEQKELWNLIQDKFVNPTLVESDQLVGTDYFVFQNFPNPFNSTTTIRYRLGKPGFVSLKIYDVLGREIETIISELQDAGFHFVTWDTQNRHRVGGVYFYRLTSGPFSETKKMILLE